MPIFKRRPSYKIIKQNVTRGFVFQCFCITTITKVRRLGSAKGDGYLESKSAKRLVLLKDTHPPSRCLKLYPMSKIMPEMVLQTLIPKRISEILYELALPSFHTKVMTTGTPFKC